MQKITVRAEQVVTKARGWSHVEVELHGVQSVDLVQQIGAETLLDWVGRDVAMRHFGLMEQAERFCGVCDHAVELCSCPDGDDEDIPLPPEPLPDFISETRRSHRDN